MKYIRGLPLKDRFERHFIPEPNTGCWLWEGYAIKDGYGRFRNGSKLELAHRLSYELFCEKISEGMQVLHRCDNPPCVNPEHLFMGTITDNMRDMTIKGRGKCARGIKHHRAKLNPEKAFSIRWMSAMGMSRNAVAREFGVSKPLIKQIVQNKIWRQEAHD